MELWELITLVINLVILLIYYISNGYKTKNALGFILLMVIPCIFSVNMYTECMTADDIRYTSAFVDYKNVSDYTDSIKIVWQYRISRIFPGTIFSIWQPNVEEYGMNFLIRIYKMLHYFACFGISLGTAFVWRRIIKYQTEDVRKIQLFENLILLCLVSTPLGCLLFKVCNYDAMSIYFSILGFSLLVLASYCKVLKYSCIGILFLSLAPLEKTTAAVYWLIGVVFLCFIHTQEDRGWHRIRKNIFITSIAICFAGVLSYISLICFRVISQDMSIPINSETINHPYVLLTTTIVEDVLGMDLPDSGVIILQYIFNFVVIIVGTAVLLFCRKILEKRRNVCVFFSLFVFFVGCVVIGGIIVARFVPQYIYPWIEYPEGIYIPGKVFNGVTSFFHTETIWGYYLIKIAYNFATIFCNMPTLWLIFVVSVSIVIYRKKDCLIKHYVALMMLIIAFLLPVVFAIANQPTCPRYFGQSIFLMTIIMIYLMIILENMDRCSKSKRIIGLCLILLSLIEMYSYSPNVMCFAPVWAWHDKEYNETVRVGMQYVGEAMTWGEDMSIAGNKIVDIVDEQGKYSYNEIVVYGNYGTQWLANPGFDLKYVYEDSNVYRMDDSEYYVLSKFDLYRGSLPKYFYNVEPIATIKYHGEISSWIFRGDQLTEAGYVFTPR